MSYIYDILLNFNKNLIEYFQWEETDNIKYVKKIMLFRTTTEVIIDFIDFEVLLDSSFTSNIPKYDINNSEEAVKICLITDGKIAIGLYIKNNKVLLLSWLLLDEEYDALESSKNLVLTHINYQKLKPRKKQDNSLTRKEKRIKEILLNKIDFLYKNKKNEELRYLYYEYTNKESSNIDYIYEYLKSSLNSFSFKHIELYNILSMSGIANN